ncbi:hypothetical protein PYCCODRAFT_211276 [Trametes coccinea BRFM310]|uniref:Uncharacterized protein n=1 Tax=Trametes coccinea (strain BRFM310) TaxID=1353009 RepID=A0A1Y2IQM2_TRAC3|nr:hypothetical protein PYCCODRAFT_211276 [Trametes coccinea BRFM310]
MTVVPNPAANADLPIADPTLAATEVDLNDALIGTSYVLQQQGTIIHLPNKRTHSTVVPQGMPSSESVDNTPVTTPGATMAAESALLPPCEFRGRCASIGHCISPNVHDIVQRIQYELQQCPTGRDTGIRLRADVVSQRIPPDPVLGLIVTTAAGLMRIMMTTTTTTTTTTTIWVVAGGRKATLKTPRKAR